MKIPSLPTSNGAQLCEAETEAIEARMPHGAQEAGGPSARFAGALSRQSRGQVLAGHACWVSLSLYVLGTKLKPFFPAPFGEGSWLRLCWRTLWLPWVLFGYCSSLLLYNAVEANSAADSASATPKFPSRNRSISA